MPSLDRHGDVFVLSLAHADGVNPENRFHPEWIEQVHTLLDEAEASEGPAALVTVGGGKFYSNGLDTDYLFSHADSIPEYLDLVHTIYTRLLRFPMATVAAVQGHAFGAGAMFALAHDFRTMRADRGYYCFPEVDIDIPFTPGMAALIQAKLSPQDAVVAMTTGHRYGGDDALAARLVDAIERITSIAGKDRGTLGAIKTTMFAPVVAALRAS